MFNKKKQTPLEKLRADSRSNAFSDSLSKFEIRQHLERIATGEEEFIIIERPRDPTGMTYLQTALQPDGTFIVEHQDGDLSRHFYVDTLSIDDAVNIISDWECEAEGWNTTHMWRREFD